MNIAWFSPLPPSTSGIAAYSAELLPLLAARGLTVEAFHEDNAQDFVWRQRRNPYDLTVFQLGNAACHAYMWGYLFRYPGLLVLHDAQLHQARALALTKRWVPRRADYLAELHANHPDAPADLGELVAMGGMGGTLFQHWPFIRLVVTAARMTVVHNPRLAADLRAVYPDAPIEAVAMGVADPLAPPGPASPSPATPHAPAPPSGSRLEILNRHGMPAQATVLAAFGGITPEKRITAILRALSVLAPARPDLHLMIVGAAADHYDVLDEARTWRVADRVHVTGFVADEELGSYLQAADLCACLRWPTNRETSASWLRCLAAGRPTLISDLADLGDVPTLDPRGWRPLLAGPGAPAPIAVSIDLLDENHALLLALERLTEDATLRRDLGAAARAWWHAHHRLPAMADAYDTLCRQASRLPVPRVSLPAHLTDEGAGRLQRILDDTGLGADARAQLEI